MSKFESKPPKGGTFKLATFEERCHYFFAKRGQSLADVKKILGRQSRSKREAACKQWNDMGLPTERPEGWKETN